MCVLRLLVVPLSILGWIGMEHTEPDNPMLATVPYEVVIGASIGLFGITGNIGLLASKRWGVGLVAFALVATLASLILGVLQAATLTQDMDDTMRVASYIGAGVVLLIRLAIATAVIIALRLFLRWHNTLPVQARTFD